MSASHPKPSGYWLAPFYWARRIIWPASLLLGLCVLTFFLGHVAPGDPARIILGPAARQETVDELHAEMGFDKPLAVQFGRFLKETLTGHWGSSWLTRQPVLREIGDHLRPTLYLGFFASVYSIASALFINALAFAYPRWGNLPFLILRFGITVPSFVIAVAVVLATTGLQTRVLEALSLDTDSALVYLVPALAVALYSTCVMTALLRDCFCDILASPCYRAARSCGLPLAVLFFRVLLANSWPTLLAAWVNQISLLVFSTIVVEYVFSFRGLGSLLIRSIQGKDLPVLTGIILLNGFFFLIVRSVSSLRFRRIAAGAAQSQLKPEQLPAL